MRTRAKTLLLTGIFALAVMSAGSQISRAEEAGQTEQTEAQDQTEQMGQTEAQDQTEQTEAQDQTEQTEQTEAQNQTEQTEQAVMPEPSEKRGLQSEDGYLFYYDENGYRKTGWLKIKKKIYYFCTETSSGPLGSAATGLQQIDTETYYFDDQGVLQTGWQTIAGKRYYFALSGKTGQIGRMYTGLKKIAKKRYFFNKKGQMMTGWVLYKNKTYYFTKKKTSSKYGAAYTGWHTISKARYYFASNGVLKKDCWIGKKYYVGSDGKMLKNCVTPDGYLVDSQGLKGELADGFVKVKGKVYHYTNGKMTVGLKKIGGKRYYFQKNGVRKNSGWVTVKGDRYYIKNGVVQTGWITYKKRRYYLAANGKMAKNKTVDGIEIGSDGKAPVSILLLSGHGQGDSGATATYGSKQYREETLTREFAGLIYKKLQSIAPELNVTLYDQDYDCYQVLSGKKAGPKPNFKLYDYVLEIHFNATVESNKDISGDGECKGVGMYVNSSKKNTTIDKKIVAAVAEAGDFPIWGRGTGIFTSSGLFNARTLQAMGVSYGLLETAFIDDRDDMKVYKKCKDDMAEAAAKAIKKYYGV